MGLDITAVSSVVECVSDAWDEFEDDDSLGYDDVLGLFQHPDFKAQADGIANGIYSVEGVRFGFRAGSYGGYSRFRNLLSDCVHGVAVEEIWSEPGKWKTKAFFSILNFSDCDGFIGPQTSKELHEDFKKHRDAFHEYCQDASNAASDYTVEVYDNFMRAFAIASELGKGIVSFH